MHATLKHLSLATLVATTILGAAQQVAEAGAPTMNMPLRLSAPLQGWDRDGAALHLARKVLPGRQQRIDRCIADARATYQSILNACDREYAPNSEDRVQCYRTGWLSYQIMEGRCNRMQ